MKNKKILIFICGVTGSIGNSCINVIKKSTNLKLVGFTYHNNNKLAKKISKSFKNNIFMFSTKDTNYKKKFQEALNTIKPDFVINGISGFDGVIFSLITIANNKNLLFANKETMIYAGSIINKLLKSHDVIVKSIDSEHLAISQLQNINVNKLNCIYLTCSGGMFYNYSNKQMLNIKYNEAIKHPKWSMGKEITINSNTWMNKFHEIIEAKYLFNIDRTQIKILIHKEAIIHGMIVYNDYSVKALLAIPNMEQSIQYALYNANVKNDSFKKIDFLKLHKLSFNDYKKRKNNAIDLAYKVYDNIYLIIFISVINEILVKMFIDKKIDFYKIMELIFYYYNKYKDNILFVKTFSDVKNIIVRCKKIISKDFPYEK